MTGRVVHPGQPLWSQTDTDLAVALTTLEAGACSGCGHPRAETYNPEFEFDWRAEALRCHSCATRDREAAKGGMDTSGLHWTTKREVRGER